LIGASDKSLQLEWSEMVKVIVREEAAKYQVSKSSRAKVKFGSSIEVDAYLLPDGEIRFGKNSASISLGYGKDWVGELKGKPLELLRGKGYTGAEKSVDLPAVRGGGDSAKTISLSDYRQLIIFAARKGKENAFALLEALADISLEDFAREALGVQRLTSQEKTDRIDAIICTYYLEEQAEIDDRRLPGDDMYFADGVN
jgi:hypothetical protein